MKRRSKTQKSPRNWVQTEKHMENPQGPSRTIQGDTFSIKELIKRQANGFVDNVAREAQYAENATHEDIDIMKFQQLDIVDQAIEVENHREKYQNMVNKAKKSLSNKQKQNPEGVTPPPPKKTVEEEGNHPEGQAELKP